MDDLISDVELTQQQENFQFERANMIKTSKKFDYSYKIQMCTTSLYLTN